MVYFLKAISLVLFTSLYSTDCTRGFSRTDEVNPRHRGTFFADLWKFIRSLFETVKTTATEIQNWLIRKYKISKAALQLLEELGVIIIRNIDDSLKGSRQLITPEGFTLKYGNHNILEGTGDAIKKFSKKIEDINTSSGKKGCREYLDEIARVRKILDDFVEFRQKYNNKSFEELEEEFKIVFNPRHFKLEDLKDFYTHFKRKYPMLTQGKHKNFAEFRNIHKKNGKTIRDFKELSHSGREKLYNSFLDTISDLNFLNGVKDSTGKPKYNDSEIKWIYNFLVNHLHTGDEFIIETRNIFYTCNSCQREFLILQEYVTQMGKKMKITIYGDEDIKGTSDLFKKLNNN